MKKMLIATAYMNSAGTEMAMLNFIDALKKDDLEITVLLISSKLGVWQNRIPDYCKIKEIEMSDENKYNAVLGLGQAIKSYVKKGRFFKALRIYLGRKLKGNAMSQVSVKWNELPPIDEDYDLAVCYMGHSPFLVKYIATKVNAKRKVLFAHNNILDGKSRLSLCEGLESYDKFYGVSRQIEKELKQVVPPEKVALMHNSVPLKNIIDKSNELSDVYNGYKGIKILTVGRLSSDKGIDIAIEAFRELKNVCDKIKWFVIGGGACEKKYKEQALKLGVADDFLFLGVKDNPYPYIKQCDIYVQPSRHEGYCTTVNEARVLNKPIIATDVSGTREMLENEVNGLIVNFNKKEIADAILKLIENPSYGQIFSDNLKVIDYTNTEELKEFLQTNGI